MIFTRNVAHARPPETDQRHRERAVLEKSTADQLNSFSFETEEYTIYTHLFCFVVLSSLSLSSGFWRVVYPLPLVVRSTSCLKSVGRVLMLVYSLINYLCEKPLALLPPLALMCVCCDSCVSHISIQY